MALKFPIYSTNRHPPMTAGRLKLLVYSYAPDWAIFFSLDKVNGYRREFSLEDRSSRTHPCKLPLPNHAIYPSHASNVALVMICFVSPLVIMPIVNFITVRSWWDLHNSWLGLILSLSLTGALTQVVKITVGRPRPDLLDRCQPPVGLTDPPLRLTNWTICAQTDEAMMIDGFRSFFSGHSSLSFCGMGFLAYYLAGKMHLFDHRGHAGKAWLALSPFMAAALVAISRTMDYRHHWQDVLVGSLVGTLFSFFGYRQYYPPLSSEQCHRPFSPRIKPDGQHEVLPTYNRAHSQNVPMTGNGHHYSDSYDDNYELAGTVPRPPGPGQLREVWRDNEEDHNKVGEEAAGTASYSPLQVPTLPPLRNTETELQ
ncbi:phosphatidic acid phosphatase type 2/haloperoxidase [Gymnopilus junonius]|uniref:Phosphatidic acid phosphatase type 2/haloperoxidase n=1 Tax=Gymnopilus junonius TaxID=109634 RepID=A0A9P5TTF1_GYMJU|nr:phosphatidic acid phosphatase type 2/haloperoxidase [Gymnopilus junonius]